MNDEASVYYQWDQSLHNFSQESPNIVILKVLIFTYIGLLVQLYCSGSGLMAVLWWDMKHHSRLSLFSPLWVSVATVSCHLEGPCSPFSFSRGFLCLHKSELENELALLSGHLFSLYRFPLVFLSFCLRSFPTCFFAAVQYEFSTLCSFTTSLLH